MTGAPGRLLGMEPSSSTGESSPDSGIFRHRRYRMGVVMGNWCCHGDLGLPWWTGVAMVNWCFYGKLGLP